HHRNCRALRRGKRGASARAGGDGVTASAALPSIVLAAQRTCARGGLAERLTVIFGDRNFARLLTFALIKALPGTLPIEPTRRDEALALRLALASGDMKLADLVAYAIVAAH